jgi:hypothetical protein
VLHRRSSTIFLVLAPIKGLPPRSVTTVNRISVCGNEIKQNRPFLKDLIIAYFVPLATISRTHNLSMTYYDILELPPNATADQIKKRYRQLAVRYHPDKNTDVHAVEIFRSVTAAYEVLSDPDRKRDYDHRLNTLDVYEEPPAHRDPAYRPRRKPEVKFQKQPGGPSRRELRAKYLPYTAKLSIACLIAALLMVADYFLPRRSAVDRVSVIIVHSSHRYRWFEFRTDKHESFVLDRDSHIGLDIGDTIVIEKSFVFDIPVAVGRNQKVARLGSGIYGNFIFLPAMLLIISCFGVFTRSDVNWGFDFGVGSVVLLAFIIVFMMIF